jgi:hypothetical protein
MSDATPLTNAATLTDARDPEIVAMEKLSELFSSLDPAIRQRVLRWAADKFGVVLQKGKPASRGGNADEDTDDDGSIENGDYTDFSSLYEAAKPSTDAERALLAGYWLQIIQHKANWSGFSANKELKNLGHGTDDITGRLNQLINQKPQLVMQTRKSGKTRQAQKKYKVTGEGIKRVRQMLASTTAGSGNSGQA